MTLHEHPDPPPETPPAASPATFGLRIAVLLPCYNEEAAVSRVVRDFRASLPEAEIYVFDNDSRDQTRQRALDAGALVRHVGLPGKGNVVRRMFADVDADVYVLADGDATYHAPSARTLVDQLAERMLDMVVGTRVEQAEDAYRRGHRLGNRLLTRAMQSIFGGAFTDMLSGYRVFSRRFVKSFPATSRGFEIETELTIHALELRMPYLEIATPYGSRPSGSESKLRTYSDGFRILLTIIKLFAVERPLRFYGMIGGLLALISVTLGVPLIATYLATGEVPRFPTAVLSSGIGIVGVISMVSGVILETVTIGRREAKHLSYLAAEIPRSRPMRRGAP